MNWLEIKVIFEAKEPQLAADLISELFYALDVKGVVIEDPSLQPDEAWGETAEGNSEHHAVKGYFPENYLSQKQWQMLERGLAHLEKESSIRSQMVISYLYEEDWAESWKGYFHPEKVGQRLVVKPSWYDYQAQPGEIVLEIDPGMAFGTGTHPTTRLCLNLIEALMLPGDSLLDVGTGSGVLMIAAAKLGARKVCGIDKDAVALAVAQRNLKQNAIDQATVTLICGNLIEAVVQQFDLVVANIVTDAIIILLNDINRVLKKNRVFLCSGIHKTSQNCVIDKLKELDFEIMNIYSKDEWVAIAAKLR
jgi:ribosomal protein L11 methyltransferase